MTSVSFPFKVGVPAAGEKTVPLLEVEFRFTTKAARALERSCNGNIDQVLARGRSAEVAVLLVCYGQLWAVPDITEDEAADQIDEFIAAGGDVVALMVALYKGLNESGVYGKPPSEGEGAKRPTSRGKRGSAAPAH